MRTTSIKQENEQELNLNTEKTKIMCFIIAGGRMKDVKIQINGKKIEIVKKFRYLRYELRENNKEYKQTKT